MKEHIARKENFRTSIKFLTAGVLLWASGGDVMRQIWETPILQSQSTPTNSENTNERLFIDGVEFILGSAISKSANKEIENAKKKK